MLEPEADRWIVDLFEHVVCAERMQDRPAIGRNGDLFLRV